MDDTSVTSNSDKVTQSEYGKCNVLGVEMQFSKMLGDTIVENYIRQLSDEDMKLIMDFITKDLFEEVRDYKSSDPKALIKRMKEDWTTHSNSYYCNETHTSVGNQIKNMFNERVKKELQSKIEEIIKTKDYQDKIEEMAQEIVDYSVEGYKEDLKQSIREKMIGNVMGNQQHYGGVDLTSIVEQVVGNYIHFN